MTLGLAGCLVGLLVGVSGVGGGSLLTPLLVLLFGLPPTAAISSDLAVTAVLRFVGAIAHQARRDVHLGLVFWLSVGGVPAALVGPLMARLFGPVEPLEHALRVLLGLVLVTVAVVNAWSLRRRSAGQLPPSQVDIRKGRVVLLGLVTGLLIGITSVGSGSVVVAVLLIIHPRLRPSSVVATDVVQSLPTVLAAALGHYLLGDFHPDVAWPLLLGGVPGVVVGALLAPRVPVRVLRGLLVVLLASTGVGMLTSDLIAIAGTAVAMVIVVLATTRKTGEARTAVAHRPTE